ncbi:MAG: proprotein convertase P-domain-containing protein, partial [Candidatus Omnitrophota bacterium]|nr:proprotein convertase P-domain-containing protein [Candidatus Omnitrophota bacterium]
GDTYSKDSEVTIVKSDKEAINLDISADTGKGGAFNILDTVMRGSDKVKELSGSVPPLITVKWQVGVDPGTAYGNNVIELNGSSNDPDEYDDCVILHEYGHFVAVKYSYDKSPGGDHRANDTNQDIRLSWSEGWAYFFSSMVRNTPLLIDTDKDSQGNSRCAVFDIETLGHSRYGSLIDYAQGQDTEVSVSSVLWDIYDPINDAGDALALGASPIWIVVHSFNGSYDCALEDFYNGIFINPANEAYRSQINSIFSERKVFYSTPFFKRGKIFTKTDGSAIPSGMPDGLSSVLAVSDDLSILNMNVFVDLPHNQRSDLLVKLISPSKKEAILHNHTNPQSGQRESIFTWYQPPYETIPDGDVPGTGQAVNAFDIFKNEPSKGDWILKVTDAGGQQSGNAGILDRWKLEISRNQPPEFELIGDKTVDEGKLLEFNILAKDPNNQALTYSATGLPYGAYFIPEKRLVSWLSDYNQQGEYTVHFEVTNGSLKDAEDIKIIVNDVTIKPVSGKSVGVGLKVRVIE